MSIFNTTDAEYYFIQLLFCKNRDLLRKDYRGIYDVMFQRYEKIYKEGKEKDIDIQLINEKFLKLFKKVV